VTSSFRSSVWVRRALLVALAVAGSVAATAYLRWAIQVDPFAQYRPPDQRTRDLMIGVQLEDVKVWHWTQGKLVLTCDVGRVDVRRDRQHLDFYDVHDGMYRGEKNSFQFAGPKANYNASLQTFQVTDGARVWNADLDLRADALLYRRRVGRLQTQGAVTGRLFEGQLQAENVVYFPETKDFEAGPVVWEGKLKSSPLQEVTGDQSAAPWKIKADKFSRSGDAETYVNGEATDGDVLVKAPKLERNARTDVLTATGGVHYYSKKANLLCDKVVVYRREKRAVLTGNVSMLVKPEDQEKLVVEEIQPFRPQVPEQIAASRPKAPRSPEQRRADEELRSTKTARKYPVQINADRIEYWYREGQRRANVTGSPQARQDFPNGRWRHMWTHKAFYDAEKETLRLTSSEGKKDTRIMTSIGDDLIATWFLTSTKDEGEDQWEGEGVEGTVVSDDDDLNRRNPPPGNPPPALRGRIGGA
jgi:lipopolysaccharide export system protein LptA